MVIQAVKWRKNDGPESALDLGGNRESEEDSFFIVNNSVSNTGRFWPEVDAAGAEINVPSAGNPELLWPSPVSLV